MYMSSSERKFKEWTIIFYFILIGVILLSGVGYFLSKLGWGQ